VTPSETPDRSQAADSIDRFLASVSTWLHWHKLVQMEEDLAAGLNPIDTMPVVKALLEPFVAPSLPPDLEAATEAYERERAARRAFELMGKQNGQGAKVRDEGRALAVTLESLGLDSTPVLTIVHCTEAHGGGPAYVLPRWEDLNGRLRRVAIQLRTAAPRLRVEEGPGEPRQGGTTRKGDAEAARGAPRKRLPGKGAVREELKADYEFGDKKLLRFMHALIEAGNGGREGRDLWVYLDAARSAAPGWFKRRPRMCPKCKAQTACPSCGQCPTCAAGRCSCDRAPNLEGDFLG
jgi:hypothetical protein